MVFLTIAFSFPVIAMAQNSIRGATIPEYKTEFEMKTEQTNLDHVQVCASSYTICERRRVLLMHIKNYFKDAKEAYSLILMTTKRKEKMLEAMQKLRSKIARLQCTYSIHVNDMVGDIRLLVEDAIFELTTGNSPREAHKYLKKAKKRFDKFFPLANHYE
jgi:ribosomal protein S15P/S13E